VTEARYAALYELSDTHWWCQGMQHLTHAMLEPLNDEATPTRMLDAGCGAGVTVAWPHDHAQSVGLDLSMQALNTSHMCGVSRLVAGSIERLPFEDRSFDLVTALDVLYHAGIGDNRQALADIWRVLRPGGWLLVRLPAYSWLRGPHDAVMGTRRRFTTRSAEKLLTDACFEGQRTTYANMCLFPLEAGWRLIRRLFTRQGEYHHARGDLFSTPARLNRLLAGILKSEKHLVRRVNLPCGLSIFCLARKPAIDN